MATPTSTEWKTGGSYLNVVTGSNVDAGNNDYSLIFDRDSLKHGFSIVTGTLTNMTVTVLGYNYDSAKAVDITTDLFGAAALASSKGYACDVPLPFRHIIIRAARSNATNAIYLEIYAPRR